MPLKELLTGTWRGVLDVLYPPKCLVCGAFGRESVCPICRAAFRPVPAPVCNRCGETKLSNRCKQCDSGVPRHLAQVRSAGQFEGTLRDAILKLKYHDRPLIAPILGSFLAGFLKEKPFGEIIFDLVVPVPLDRARLRERGFNQSELIARFIAKKLQIPLDPTAISRTRRTRAQVDLNAEQRKQNVKGAFVVNSPASVSGKTVLLVDDVATTTHTGDECARVINDAGARAVFLATVARDI